jgi:ACT domain-containing protein
MMKKILQLSAITLLGFSLSAISHASTIVETAYGRRADISVLTDIVKLKNLEEIVNRLENEGVRIYKVKMEGIKESRLSFLKDAPVDLYPDLAEKIADVDSRSAMFCTKSEISNSKTNIILIAEDAEPMTLIHEFMHHLFETQNHDQTDYITETQKKYSVFLRRFNFKTRKVMLDNGLLVSKLWRSEIEEVAEEYANTINEGQGQIAAEEVAIESALSSLLQNDDGFLFNLTRAKEGVNGYALGLTIRSESLVRNIIALDDLVITEGLNQDPEATMEERQAWLARKEILENKLNDYLNGPLAIMGKQVKSAQNILALKEKEAR